MSNDTDQDDGSERARDVTRMLEDRVRLLADQLVDEFGADSCVILVTHYDRATCMSTMDYAARGNRQACIGSVERYRRIMHR